MSKVMSGMVAGVVLVLLVCSAADRYAAAEPRGNGIQPAKVAVVDMVKVLKSAPQFDSRRSQLKADIAESEELYKAMNVAIQRLKQEIDSFEKGSKDRNELEEQLKVKTADYENYRKVEATRFLKAEAVLYGEIYQRITSEVGNYARSHGIDLVIRFTSDPLTEEDPQKLLQSANRQVVYENGLDITDDIIAIVKSRR